MWGDDGGSYLPPGSGVYQCHARRLKKEERVIRGKEGIGSGVGYPKHLRQNNPMSQRKVFSYCGKSSL